MVKQMATKKMGIKGWEIVLLVVGLIASVVVFA